MLEMCASFYLLQNYDSYTCWDIKPTKNQLVGSVRFGPIQAESNCQILHKNFFSLCSLIISDSFYFFMNPNSSQWRGIGPLWGSSKFLNSYLFFKPFFSISRNINSNFTTAIFVKNSCKYDTAKTIIMWWFIIRYQSICGMWNSQLVWDCWWHSASVRTTLAHIDHSK